MQRQTWCWAGLVWFGWLTYLLEISSSLVLIIRTEKEDVFDGLTVRVKIFTEVLKSADGYKRVVSHSEENLLPSEQIFHIRNKCLYLRTAYTIALNKLGWDSNNWVAICCQEALDLLASLGFDTTVDAKENILLKYCFSQRQLVSSSQFICCQWNKTKTSILWALSQRRCKYFHPWSSWSIFSWNAPRWTHFQNNTSTYKRVQRW